jgi:uncharacterized protein (DUF885 family)
VDTGLHAFGWSVDQAKDFMRSNTASSEVDIDAEVKRYCTWPGQATGVCVCGGGGGGTSPSLLLLLLCDV